ncbi:MAG: hypothetical protein COC06_05345 [Bacteroidales bacterium]|nr:MAG: hypothetical protein COC06_05345 [Bacteroidales bacterium]
MNKIIQTLFGFTLVLCCLASCEDYDSPYSNSVVGVNQYDGTVLDYLKEGDQLNQLQFDSMLFVIDSIPGLKDSLEKSSVLTIFAVPNTCFKTAINALGNFRSDMARPSLYLKDLMIEPFSVEDTLIVPEEMLLDGTIIPADTIFSYRYYDYRSQLERMTCKYIFNEAIVSEDVRINTDGKEMSSFIYEDEMNAKYEQLPASGVLYGGNQRLMFSNMNGSKVESDWLSTYTQIIDIHATNGIVHVITTGHMFGYDNFIADFKNLGYE